MGSTRQIMAIYQLWSGVSWTHRYPHTSQNFLIINGNILPIIFCRIGETRGSGIDEIGESKLSNIFNFFSPPFFSPNFCYRAGLWSIYSRSPVAGGFAWRRKTLFFIGMGRFRAFIGIKKIGINVCTNIPVLFFYWRIIRVNPLCQLPVTLLSHVIVTFRPARML